MTKIGVKFWWEIYIGITNDPERRLFQEHAVRKNAEGWIHMSAVSVEIARAVEEYFLNLGAKGGSGGGDSSAKFIYAYRIAPHTVE